MFLCITEPRSERRTKTFWIVGKVTWYYYLRGA
jgi:hypothetical protein